MKNLTAKQELANFIIFVKELLNYLEMSRNYMTTSTDPLNVVLYNSRIYKIPKFQRDYSWKKENWEDLWNDIMRLYDDDNDIHYMGAVIFKRTGELNTFEVIDGQQRLATIIILGVAAISKRQRTLAKLATQIWRLDY